MTPRYEIKGFKTKICGTLSLFFFSLSHFFQAGYHVVQDDLKLLTPLLPLPKDWDYSQMPGSTLGYGVLWINKGFCSLPDELHPQHHGEN